MALGNLNALAKSINRAKGGEDFPKLFAEEFEILLKSAKENMSRKEDLARWEYEKNTPYAFHPSNMGACARCIFYNFLKYEPEPDTTDATMKDIQDYGTDRHERIQRALLNMPSAFEYIDAKKGWIDQLHSKGINTHIAKLEENERTFGKDLLEYRFYNPDIPLWFKTDGIFSFKRLHAIFEFKTEISFNFNRRNEPNAGHVEQAHWYAHCLGLEWIFFRYEIRADLFQYKDYLIPVDKKKVEEILAKARYVKLHADNNELPPKEEDKKICDKSYCKHHKKCAQDLCSKEAHDIYMSTYKVLSSKYIP
jgi:hypothetical protein